MKTVPSLSVPAWDFLFSEKCQALSLALEFISDCQVLTIEIILPYLPLSLVSANTYMMFTGEQHTWIKQFPPHCEVSSEMLERIRALFTDNVQFIHAETK
jgi:hypothetical protein